MLQSMTGFGKSAGILEFRRVSIEIRTLNSKGLDLSVKVPVLYKELEPLIRKIIAESLHRGKIEFALYVENEKSKNTNLINRDLASSYYSEFKQLNDSWGEPPVNYLSLVLKMPEVHNNEVSEIEATEVDKVLSLTKESCDMVSEFRAKEGADLRNEFQLRIQEIRDFIKEIEPFEEERVEGTRARLLKGLNEFKGEKVDSNRFEQEMIFYIEKLDISEEKMRLKNHLNYFVDTLEHPNSGKKLGFIAQEMGREINTIGSKCNHSEMQRRVVQMKDSLEKIKEQVLNTL